MEIEHRALPAIVWLSNAGVPFDAEGWREHLGQVEEEKARLAEELGKRAPEHPEGKEWNWGSWQQVLQAFGLLGVKLPDTKEETISRCEHPLAAALLSYKKVSKLTSTYGLSLLEKVEEDGRIYASWRQIGAATGRMACSNPNLQNLPPEVRRHVRATEGRVLIKADYSQIELRIAAKISGDERMLEAYERDEDLHSITARGITGKEEITKEERKLAKAVNFGLLYGQGAEGLRNYARGSYGVEMSLEDARRYRQRFFATYPGIKAWHEHELREYRKGNPETRTLTGRRRTGVRRFTERLNSPVQGTGADGLKLALALLHERREECPNALPVLAVHDEIVVECNENRAEEVEAWLEGAMKDGMEAVLNSPGTEGPSVPVEVETEVGKTWAS
ncbi:MAG: DNA polymerase [Actinomycetota bacterium]|nr:DNA polymerase [Actinomycetota bacterium]